MIPARKLAGESQAIERPATTAAVRQPIPLRRRPAGPGPTQSEHGTPVGREVRAGRTVRAPANHQAAGPVPNPRRSGADTVPAPSPARDRAVPAGRALPADLRARLAPILGSEAVGAARIHIGPTAHARARAHEARAVALGDDIFFADGRYEPGTRAGDQLIAHEVAHVAQARRGLLRGPGRKAMRQPDTTPLELAADRAAEELAGPGVDEDLLAKAKLAVAGGTTPAAGGPNGDRPVLTLVPAPSADAQSATAAGASVGGDPLAANAVPGAPLEGEATAPAEGGDAAGAALALVPPGLPLIPEPATSLSAGEKQRISGVQRSARAHVGSAKTAPEPKENVSVAQAAVKVPQTESDARAAQEVVAALAKTAPSVEIEALCKRIKDLIKSKRPADEDAVIDTRPQEVAQAAGEQVEGDVDKKVETANASYKDMGQKPSGPATADPKGIEPLPSTVSGPAVNAGSAVPDAVASQETSLEGDKAKMDQQATDAGLGKETAQLVQEGPIADARDAQGEMGGLAQSGPDEVLKQQQDALASADAKMLDLQARALASLKAARTGHVGKVKGQQTDLKGGEEALRKSLADRADKVFLKAQDDVRDVLKDVHDTAMEKWTKGLPIISKAFNDDLKVVKDEIEERHSGVGGFFVAGWDAVTGLPGWATRAYDRAEKNYGDGVCELITTISKDVNHVIGLADGIIKAARDEIHGIFTKDLPKGLEGWAAEQEKGFGKKLDQLHNEAEKTRTDFNKELIENAGNAVQAARSRIQKLREEAGGLWGRFTNALRKFLDDPLKFIIEGLLSLLGIPPPSFWAVVAKIQKVVSDIVDAPLRFAKNLLAGVGQGFTRFFDNIGTHLFAGLIEWLLSGLKDVGITVEVPKEFSLKSVVTFFLQLLGLTWARIRKLLVEQLGEKAVAAMEKTVGVIATLAKKGISGIWDDIKKMVDPKAILDAILDAAIRYISETLIVKVAQRIVLMFNPVGAVLAALEAIYRVLKWIFFNAAKIFHLIEAVVNGMADVIAGNIGGMAKTVEKALAMLVAPVIDFLADYLGLGGLPAKVASAIKGLQSWVEGIVRSVVKWLVDLGRKLLASMGIGGKEDKKGKKGDGEIGETLTFTQGDETHKLFISVKGSEAIAMVASTPTTVSNWLAGIEERANAEKRGDERAEANRLIALARGQLAKTDAHADDAARLQAAATKSDAPAPVGEGSAEALDAKVEQAEESLRDTLEKLGALFGGGPDVIKAVAVARPATLKPPYTPALILDMDELLAGSIYTSTTSDETQIGKIVTANSVAFDKKTGTLTLPGIRETELANARQVRGMGRTIGEHTLARQALFSKTGDSFAVDVGFDFYARNALTGPVLLTPQRRLVEFRDRSEIAKVTAANALGGTPPAPRYTPGQGAEPYPETSLPFRNEEYLGFFSSSRPEQKLDSTHAGTDLALWLAGDRRAGQLSRVGSATAVTYLITRGSTFRPVVIDTLSAQVDPVLQQAVLGIGIVPFMKAMAQGKAAEGITFARLQEELWPHRPNAQWLAERFRTYNKSAGMHEWIPSSSIPSTIALAASASDWVKGEKWIDLHHEMRADTGDLIGKPNPYWVQQTTAQGAVWVPHGHDGAVEDPKDGARTKNFGPDGPFHSALFNNIASSTTLADCIAGARRVFEQFIWNDEQPNSPLAPGLRIRGAVVTDLEGLRSDQAARFKAILATFDALAGKYKD